MVLTRHVFQKLSFPIMKTPRHNLFFVISRFKLMTFHKKSLLFPLSIKRTIRYVRHYKIILKKKFVRYILLSSWKWWLKHWIHFLMKLFDIWFCIKLTSFLISGSLQAASFPPNKWTPNVANTNISTIKRTDT